MKKPKFKRRAKKEEPSSVRITNETVAEHRERVLAGGRRFKYPIQYAKQKLVFNAIIVAVVALAIIMVVFYWQLYPSQNTSSFFYRVTKILPLPVGSVDGESVRYSDYLMRYRSQEYWLTQKGQIEQGQKDSERQLTYIKRSVMDGVEADAYAAKLAREKNITVTDDDVDGVVKRGLETANGTISQDLYDASTLETLGYTRDEYRLLIAQSLLRQKVAYALDDKAEQTIKAVQTLVAAPDADFDQIAKQVGNGAQAGISGMVRKNNQDGGLTETAIGLQKGKISSVVKSTTGDGYYFVRLTELTDTQLSYSYIKVPLTVFNDSFNKLRVDNKITEYISIPRVKTELTK
jgi:hypothetical protein